MAGEPGSIGVSLRALDEELAGVLGAPNGKGMLVTSVEPDSPAARAGLRPGDILVSAAGEPIQNLRDFATVAGKVEPGSALALTVVRSGRPTKLRVAVGEALADRTAHRGSAQGQAAMLGLSLALHRGNAAAQEGVIIERVDPGSVAEEHGLRTGDIILQVDGRPVMAPREVAEAVDAAREAERPGIAMQIAREEGRVSVALPLRKKG